MIIQTTKEINGIVYDYAYSDSGYMIERNGVRYSEAVDPIGSNREYTETEEPIESDTGDATVADYQSALSELGVEVWQKKELSAPVSAAKSETKNALQTVYDALNQGQKKKTVRDDAVKALFDRYGVEYTAWLEPWLKYTIVN